MLCLIPFYSGDVEATRILLNWIKQLGGCKKHDCTLVVDADVQWSEAMTLWRMADEIFASAEMIATDDPQSGWPQGPNWLFRTGACHAKERNAPFFWLEPDAIPLKSGWLDVLEAEYGSCGKPFMGAVLDCDQPGLPTRYLAGVAVYPPNAIDLIGPPLENRPHIAWDVAAADAVVPHSANSMRLQHFWGMARQSPTFTEVRPHNGQNNSLSKSDLWPDAVVFHRNKDGSLVRMLGGEAPHWVAHGGDVGDLIYGLAAMKTMGYCRLTLHWHPVREGFNPDKFMKLYPLLAIQPYLSGVNFKHERPEPAIDMNKFRQWNWDRRNGRRIESIAQSHLRFLNLPEKVLLEQWLCVDEPVVIPGKKVVFNRTHRYRNHRFPWQSIYAQYGRQAVFVGLPQEHEDFCKEVGPVDYFPTNNYLDLARVIAGAVLFVGNQSCSYAMAEGLKQNAILEVCPGCEDCQFYRANLQNDPYGKVFLYKLEDLERVATLSRAI